MSELRVDVLTGVPTLLVPGRRAIGATRPGGLPEVPRGACPFCPGHEAETEPTLLALGEPWRVRVVANRYPLIDTALGHHEVVIESHDHDADLATGGEGYALDVLTAIRARLRAHEASPRLQATSVFRNRGRRAGSSQPHPHAQLVATTMLPAAIAQRDEIARRRPGLLAELIEEERSEGTRVVLDEGEVIAWCPYASHRAWETRVALTARCPRLSATDDEQLAALARALSAVTSRLRAALGAHDYNVLLRDPGLRADTFFTIDVLPRTGGDAGFELQSGTPVCVVAPEHAAHVLRGEEGQVGST